MLGEDLQGSRPKILPLIRQDVNEIADKYSDARRTTLVDDNFSLDEASLYRRENVVISLTENGYIKRVGARHYRAQNRGGKGMKGMTIKDDDSLLDIFFAYSHDTILFFSDRGWVYTCRAYEIDETSRDRRGVQIQKILHLESDEKITAILALKEEQAAGNGCLVLATERGQIKRVLQQDFMDVRSNGLKALRLREGDTVRWVKWSSGNQKIVVASVDGQSIVFHEHNLRVLSRAASGVKAMQLKDGDEIAGMDVVPDDGAQVLVVTLKGHGKRTPVTKYPVQNRYGFGVRTLRRNDRTGPVIAVRCVKTEDEIMLISKSGIVLRTRLSEISEIGRNTQGVRVMNLDENDEVAGIAIMLAEDDTDEKDGSDFSNNGASEDS